MSSPDVSSAEWITEAPAECDSSGRCQQLSLSNFGTITFKRASATSGSGHTGSISDSAWSATRIELVESAGAVASALSSGGSSFSIAYQENAVTSARRLRTFPGARLAR